MTARFSHIRIALLIAALALTAAGCDSNDDKDDSEFAVFAQGRWEVTAFSIDAIDNLERDLDDKYSSVNVVFSEDNDTGARQFDFEALARENGEDRRIGGALEIDSGNRVLFLDPESGITSRSFQLEYEILNSTEINLTATNIRDDGAIMREFLLPERIIGSQRPVVGLTIERPAFPENE